VTRSGWETGRTTCAYFFPYAYIAGKRDCKNDFASTAPTALKDHERLGKDDATKQNGKRLRQEIRTYPQRIEATPQIGDAVDSERELARITRQPHDARTLAGLGGRRVERRRGLERLSLRPRSISTTHELRRHMSSGLAHGRACSRQ